MNCCCGITHHKPPLSFSFLLLNCELPNSAIFHCIRVIHIFHNIVFMRNKTVACIIQMLFLGMKHRNQIICTSGTSVAYEWNFEYGMGEWVRSCAYVSAWVYGTIARKKKMSTNRNSSSSCNDDGGSIISNPVTTNWINQYMNGE